MEDFDQLENRRILIKNIAIIGGIVLVCVGLVAFIMFQRIPKSVTDQGNTNLAGQLGSGKTATTPVAKALYSPDLTTWTNYAWPGKINTHYPSDWQLVEDKNSSGITTALEITPPTNNATDTIFIGGTTVKCSNVSILQYSANKCLQNKTIKVPFYTNSTNPEVLSAFNTIFLNSILDVVK